MDGTTREFGLPLLFGGLLMAGAGFLLGGSRVRKTVYRPDRWGVEDVVVALCGVLTAAVLYLSSSVAGTNLYPSLNPLRWPEIAVLPMLGILIALLPAWLAPPAPVLDRAEATR
jgi:energy-coupling factor transport system permease protein